MELIKSILAGLGLGAILILIFESFATTYPRDSTDQPEGKRSGMHLLVDHETGCEYLSRKSGLTPRLDAAGKQICRTQRPES